MKQVLNSNSNSNFKKKHFFHTLFSQKGWTFKGSSFQRSSLVQHGFVPTGILIAFLVLSSVAIIPVTYLINKSGFDIRPKATVQNYKDSCGTTCTAGERQGNCECVEFSRFCTPNGIWRCGQAIETFEENQHQDHVQEQIQQQVQQTLEETVQHVEEAREQHAQVSGQDQNSGPAPTTTPERDPYCSSSCRYGCRSLSTTGGICNSPPTSQPTPYCRTNLNCNTTTQTCIKTLSGGYCKTLPIPDVPSEGSSQTSYQSSEYGYRIRSNECIPCTFSDPERILQEQCMPLTACILQKNIQVANNQGANEAITAILPSGYYRLNGTTCHSCTNTEKATNSNCKYFRSTCYQLAQTVLEQQEEQEDQGQQTECFPLSNNCRPVTSQQYCQRAQDAFSTENACNEALVPDSNRSQVDYGGWKLTDTFECIQCDQNDNDADCVTRAQCIAQANINRQSSMSGWYRLSEQACNECSYYDKFEREDPECRYESLPACSQNLENDCICRPVTKYGQTLQVGEIARSFMNSCVICTKNHDSHCHLHTIDNSYCPFIVNLADDYSTCTNSDECRSGYCGRDPADNSRVCLPEDQAPIQSCINTNLFTFSPFFSEETSGNLEVCRHIGGGTSLYCPHQVSPSVYSEYDFDCVPDDYEPVSNDTDNENPQYYCPSYGDNSCTCYLDNGARIEACGGSQINNDYCIQCECDEGERRSDHWGECSDGSGFRIFEGSICRPCKNTYPTIVREQLCIYQDLSECENMLNSPPDISCMSNNTRGEVAEGDCELHRNRVLICKNVGGYSQWTDANEDECQSEQSLIPHTWCSSLNGTYQEERYCERVPSSSSEEPIWRECVNGSWIPASDPLQCSRQERNRLQDEFGDDNPPTNRPCIWNDNADECREWSYCRWDGYVCLPKLVSKADYSDDSCTCEMIDNQEQSHSARVGERIVTDFATGCYDCVQSNDGECNFEMNLTLRDADLCEIQTVLDVTTQDPFMSAAIMRAQDLARNGVIIGVSSNSTSDVHGYSPTLTPLEVRAVERFVELIEPTGMLMNQSSGGLPIVFYGNILEGYRYDYNDESYQRVHGYTWVMGDIHIISTTPRVNMSGYLNEDEILEFLIHEWTHNRDDRLISSQFCPDFDFEDSNYYNPDTTTQCYASNAFYVASLQDNIEFADEDTESSLERYRYSLTEDFAFALSRGYFMGSNDPSVSCETRTNTCTFFEEFTGISYDDIRENNTIENGGMLYNEPGTGR